MWASSPWFQQINAGDEATSLALSVDRTQKQKKADAAKGPVDHTGHRPERIQSIGTPREFSGPHAKTLTHRRIDRIHIFSSLSTTLLCSNIIHFRSQKGEGHDTARHDTRTPQQKFLLFFFGPQQSNLATRSSFIIASLNPFGTVGAALASAERIFYMPFPPPCVTNNINFIGRLRRPPSLSAASINFIAAAPPSPGLTSIGRVFIFFFICSLRTYVD